MEQKWQLLKFSKDSSKIKEANLFLDSDTVNFYAKLSLL